MFCCRDDMVGRPQSRLSSSGVAGAWFYTFSDESLAQFAGNDCAMVHGSPWRRCCEDLNLQRLLQVKTVELYVWVTAASLTLLSWWGVSMESLGGTSWSVWRKKQIWQAIDDLDIKFLSKRKMWWIGVCAKMLRGWNENKEEDWSLALSWFPSFSLAFWNPHLWNPLALWNPHLIMLSCNVLAVYIHLWI